MRPARLNGVEEIVNESDGNTPGTPASTTTSVAFGLNGFSEYDFSDSRSTEEPISGGRQGFAQNAPRRNTRTKRPLANYLVDEEVIERQPILAMGPYGVKWHESVLTGPQNAFKFELRDAYLLVGSMMVRSSAVVEGDYAQFLGWFKGLCAFIELYFTAEEDVLYPALEKDKPLGGLLIRQKRIAFKEKLAMILQAINKTKHKAVGDGLPRVVRQVKRALDKFTVMLLGYMSEQFKLIPRILSRSYKPQEGLKVTQNFARVFIKSRDASTAVVMLGRWMRAELPDKLFLEWRYECLSKAAQLKFPIWEKQFEKRNLIVQIFAEKRKAHISLRGEAMASMSSLGSLPSMGTFGDLYFEN